jgi:hypothetical protein
MFTMELKGFIRQLTPGNSAVIILGPPSFGVFSSIKAGKNMIRISTRVVIIIVIISVRFGIICSLLSNIA